MSIRDTSALNCVPGRLTEWTVRFVQCIHVYLCELPIPAIYSTNQKLAAIQQRHTAKVERFHAADKFEFALSMEMNMEISLCDKRMLESIYYVDWDVSFAPIPSVNAVICMQSLEIRQTIVKYALSSRKSCQKVEHKIQWQVDSVETQSK